MLNKDQSRNEYQRLSVLATIVLYKMRPDDSSTFETFIASSSDIGEGRERVRVLLWDNTPDPAPPGPLPANVSYEAALRNAGLAAAYNRALDVAQELGAAWLLLLDQDTVLPRNFLESLLKQINDYDAEVRVAALVPLVRSGLVVSPKKVSFFGLRSLPKSRWGIQKQEIMSINSGSAIRCDFLRSIGGFNRAYWLDYLDHWLFRRIYGEGKQAVVYNCVLEHSLSVQDYRRNISLTRYRSILSGESSFITTHKPKTQIPLYLLRLFIRAGRMAARGQMDLALVTMVLAAKIMLHPNRSLEGIFNETEFLRC